jgi:hypothetical protein
MSEEDAPQSLERDALFYEKMDRALRDLFKKAQAAQELHFAMALMPEFRGMQDGGWSTAEDAVQAYNEYGGLMEQLPKGPLRIRVALALYNHVAESGGLYEVPKKLLLTIEGKGNNSWPFLNCGGTRRLCHMAIRSAATETQRRSDPRNSLAGL